MATVAGCLSQLTLRKDPQRVLLAAKTANDMLTNGTGLKDSGRYVGRPTSAEFGGIPYVKALDNTRGYGFSHT